MSQASQIGAAGVAAPPAAQEEPQRHPRPQTSDGLARSPPPPPPSLEAQAPAQRKMNTPQRLRLLSLGVVVAGLVIGLIGALTFAYLAVSLSRAKADTAQLIRVQKIQSNLLSADATATNAFLVGGLEPPAQRAAYDEAMSSTSSLIAEAARAQPADGVALAALNQQVVNYAATIEQARANNRQGLPVGAQYLRNASAQLRSDDIAHPGQPRECQCGASRRRDASRRRLYRPGSRRARARRGDRCPDLAGSQRSGARSMSGWWPVLPYCCSS